jgi:diguanylate cyclase (GGDEF)-like protein/PAS domain S-box-containing protein
VTERRAAEQDRAASEERHRVTLDALEEATALYRVDGASFFPTMMNRAARRLVGAEAGEFAAVVNAGVPNPIAEDGSPIAPADTAAAIAARTGRPVDGTIVGFRRDDATVTWFRVTAHPILDASGKVVMVATTATDITESWTTQKALDAAQARFASMVEHSSDLITITSADECLTYASPAFGRIFGEDGSSHLGRPIWELVHPEDRERVGAIFADLKAVPGGVAAFECRIVRADGSLSHVHISQTNLLDNPAVQGFIGNAHDITDRVEATNRLAHQATHDSLTGLPNRELLLDRLALALARASRSHAPVALLFIDLDGFKQVNDRLGHDSGDAVLIEVARRLTELTRPSDTVARLGGDEFVAVLEGMHELEAFTVAERFQTTLATPYRLSSGIANIKASIGVATSNPGSTVDGLLAAADRSMYAVKGDHARENTGSRQG